ncbi:MAG: hypothetical protein M1836_000588 [Candelina mexicana]|nr:MAG: hypothetical protein M1836_000588 [Candelina mexicana]
MATTARQQPHWQPPSGPNPEIKIPPLKLWNSLTRTKIPFVPLDPQGKKVSWYACGPTVYDDAHLGHARNYVSTDIIRRILRDYFRYEVKFVMNITDVDDKIIVRGRQQHLLAEFTASHDRLDDPEVLRTTKSAYDVYARKNLPHLPDQFDPQQYSNEVGKAYGRVLAGGTISGEGVPGDKEAKVKMHIKTMSAASDAIISITKDASSMSMVDFYGSTQDVLLPYLDSLYGTNINAEDHSIFTKLTQKFEDRFMEDVRALNCLDPDEVTRVTGYGPQIVSFVERIVNNSFAYATSDGSVYFDIKAFEASGNHYARLEPWNRNDLDLQADGEGALTKKNSEKRSDADFALWKSSKPGEPSWPSPWGKGRPGWHIECSAMASDKLGEQLDIHSGGIDLAFPHHDNELAQSEAYWLKASKDHEQSHQHQWVNYFLHMGHLSIQGSKMSKSLKNFTTIREALGRGDWTPRGLRIVFLLGGWKEGVEITDDLVKAGNSWEDKVNNFFIRAKDVISGSETTRGATQSSKQDQELREGLEKAQSSLFDALCDSINTPSAMATVSELITTYNTVSGPDLSRQSVEEVATWITSIINTLGLGDPASTDSIGWSGIDIPEASKAHVYPLSKLRDELRQRVRSQGITAEELLELCEHSEASGKGYVMDPAAAPYAKLLSEFRRKVRELATSGTPSSKEILQLCDAVRDAGLWNVGIYLEDREGQPALVRRLDAELVAARGEKAERERQKEAAKEERERNALERAEKGKLRHLDMFRTEEYSAWDDEGLPVKDAQGEDIAKSKTKKLKKEWEKQKKLHETWMANRRLKDEVS